MVIENPIQFTMVKEAPLVSSGADCATRVEKSGESAITTSPQKNRNPISNTGESFNKINGERIQHVPESDNAITAVFFAPYHCEIKPLNTQAILPLAIITKDRKERLSSVPGCCFCQPLRITGTKAQKAYSSHI